MRHCRWEYRRKLGVHYFSYLGIDFLAAELMRMGRDSSEGIATRYGVDGPGIESRLVRDFRTRPDRLWDLRSLLYNGYWGFPGGKAAGAWR
jgi:hypothetical protein